MIVTARKLCLPGFLCRQPRIFSTIQTFLSALRKHSLPTSRALPIVDQRQPLHRLVWQHYSALTHKESFSPFHRAAVDKSLRKQERGKPRGDEYTGAREVSWMINTSIRATIHVSQRNASTILYIKWSNLAELSRRKRSTLYRTDAR